MKSQVPIIASTLILSMQEGHIEHSKERFANDHWQMLNKEMPLFNKHTSRKLHHSASGRMPMSVKSVHVIDRVRAVRFAVTKSKTLEFQTSIQGAKKKKTDADRADDKHGRFIGIKAEKVIHSAVDISEREHRVPIMRIPAVGEDVLERIGFAQQVPGFFCLRYGGRSLQGKKCRFSSTGRALPLSPSKRMALLNDLSCRIHTGKENTYFTIPILYLFLIVLCPLFMTS